MSVTFSAAIDETVPLVFVVECADGEIREDRRGSHKAMLEVFVAHRDGECVNEDCRMYGPILTTLEDPDEPQVNVSNVNARTLLEALGLSRTPAVATLTSDLPTGDEAFGVIAEWDDLCGELPAEDFLGRVLLAQGLSPEDAGLPATVTGGPGTGHAQVIYCGRAPGYLQDRLTSLAEVARWAAAHDRPVSWG